ncbi:MAG TPA: hypothetical protein VGM89_15625 [Puia sp.]|jgi:hypothetical protein
MNLQECKSGPKAGRKSVVPAIGINNFGVFCFNKAAMRLLGIAGGERVKIFKDIDEPENWYIEIVATGGFRVQKRPESRLFPRFNAAEVANEIFDTVGFEGKYGRIIIAGQPTLIGKRKLYGLIISRLKSI